MKLHRPNGILPAMRSSLLAALAICLSLTVGVPGQSPTVVDTAKLGPQLGATAPAFTGTDQFGKPQTLASTYGPKGTMLVFFRSADW